MRNFLAFLIVECDDFFLNGDLETQRQCYAIFQNKQKNNKKQIAKLFLRKLLKIYEHSTKPKTCFFYTLLYKIKLNDFDFEFCEYVEYFSFRKEY